MIGDRLRTVKGFTVAEILVVTFLFGIAVTILSQTYVSFIRLSHRTANAAVIQQDMRFTMEYLSRNIRTVPIDYPSPPDTLDSVSDTLRLKAEGQPSWIVRKSSPGSSYCGDEASVSCLLVSADGGVTWAPITSKHVNVEKFDVYIRPLESPFVLSGNYYLNDQQPFITINVKMSYVTPNEREKANLETQTTISSRVYVR